MFIIIILAGIFGAICNRARGTRLYGFTNSTEIGRIIAMAGFSLISALTGLPDPITMGILFLWSMATLMAWCSPGWDAYWSAAIGNDPKHSRLWGLGMMTLRQLLIIPYFAGIAFFSGHGENAWFATEAILLGLPYYVLGKINKDIAIPYAEYCNGALIGILTLFATGCIERLANL